MQSCFYLHLDDIIVMPARTLTWFYTGLIFHRQDDWFKVLKGYNDVFSRAGCLSTTQTKCSSCAWFQCTEAMNFLLLYCLFSTVCRPAFILLCTYEIKYCEAWTEYKILYCRFFTLHLLLDSISSTKKCQNTLFRDIFIFTVHVAGKKPSI